LSIEEFEDSDELSDEEFEQFEKYRMPLDGNWKLSDLYEFPHAFSQCYTFEYCLDSELSTRDSARIDEAFQSYPWRGGYSYVNLYSRLESQIPGVDRPRIASIHKASPGWLELFLNQGVAFQVAQAIVALSASLAAAAKAYASISKTLYRIKVEREKAKLEALHLSAAQKITLMKMAEEFAEFLGFENLQKLHERTGSPEVSVKLLLAHYRRLSVVEKFVRDGKVTLPVNK
jgi:hypothetical protein